MADLTFLFSDVEGSTRLWEQAPMLMRQALARHDELMEGCVAANAGQLVRPRGEGDSRFAVFARAADALAAARDIQQALFAEAWVTPQPIRVRLALHTGHADWREGDYYGPEVNRCARLRSLACGGQTLVSQATVALARDAVPPQVIIRDLGEHRLKDLQRPERVYELDVLGLPAEFPPLASVDAFPNNLPVQLTSFIGREHELAEIKQLLAAAHLLTLSGPGGTGKTRLSLQVAADLLESFPEGVWFIDLAPLSNPGLVAAAAAAVLGVREVAGRSMLTALADYVHNKRLLFVLDNCEHVLDACCELAAAVLRASPRVKILATSREALNVGGETIYRVHPLSLPPQGAAPELFDQSEAVRLFVERAALAQPRFTLSASNADAVARVCSRLDGIPLAIELAAARIRLLSVEQIAERLDDRFRLLTGGRRDALPRQQTLRALIDWSYDLLSEPERALLHRLSVFAGGCTLAAVEAIWEDKGAELALDLLTRLVDKSLVIAEAEEGAARYRMLETIREYAAARLSESGEADRTRNKHLEFYCRWAEAGEPQSYGGPQVAWFDRLRADHDNLGEALKWSLASGRADVGLRLAAALHVFWFLRGHWSEGQEWLEKLLAENPSAPVSIRIESLFGLAMLIQMQRDLPHAKIRAEECLALAREVGDKRGMGMALWQLADLANYIGDNPQAMKLAEESVGLLREAGDKYYLSAALGTMGYITEDGGDLERALPLYEQSLRMRQELGDNDGICYQSRLLGVALYAKGEHARAIKLLEGCLTLAREVSSPWNTAASLRGLGFMLLDQGDYAQPRAFFGEALGLFEKLGDLYGIATSLHGMAIVLTGEGQLERAATLSGAAARLAKSLDWSFAPLWRKLADRSLADLETELGEDQFKAAWTAGQAMTMAQAIADALLK